MANDTCFETIDSDSAYKTILISLSVATSLTFIPFGLGIIWFEKFGSDKKRTIVNKLMAALSWNSMLLCSTCQLAYCFRFYFGPLAPMSCYWWFVVRKTLIINGLLLLNSMTLMRYVFIFWLKNPAAFNDEFWFIFINIWTLVFSFLTQFTRALVPGSQLLEYSICSGEDPSNALSQPPFLRGYIELPSIVFQVFAFLRISWHKHIQAKKIGPLIQPLAIKNAILHEFEGRSLTSLTFNVFCVLLLVLAPVLSNSLTVTGCKDLLDNYKSVVLVYSYLILPNLITLLLGIFFFMRNRLLWKTVKRELENGISCCQNK